VETINNIKDKKLSDQPTPHKRGGKKPELYQCLLQMMKNASLSIP
jgi:hypothetical protein